MRILRASSCCPFALKYFYPNSSDRCKDTSAPNKDSESNALKTKVDIINNFLNRFLINILFCKFLTYLRDIKKGFLKNMILCKNYLILMWNNCFETHSTVNVLTIELTDKIVCLKKIDNGLHNLLLQLFWINWKLPNQITNSKIRP